MAGLLGSPSFWFRARVVLARPYHPCVEGGHGGTHVEDGLRVHWTYTLGYAHQCLGTNHSHLLFLFFFSFFFLLFLSPSLHETATVNGIEFAPSELGLILAGASSDGYISIHRFVGIAVPITPFISEPPYSAPITIDTTAAIHLTSLATMTHTHTHLGVLTFPQFTVVIVFFFFLAFSSFYSLFFIPSFPSFLFLFLYFFSFLFFASNYYYNL